MAEVGSAFLSIIPSAKGFGGALSAQVAPEIGAAGKASGTRFSAGFKLALVAGVAAAGVAAAKFIGSSIAEARESQKIGKATAQLIKNQGSAATVSAGQVGKLATSISNKTGVDDEAIQSGQNLLLSFQTVQNQAGAGNQIFNRASKSIVDLGTKMGSPSAAAKVLGKALNDPEKGMTALNRAGVPLTKNQQAQVKAFAKTGDTLSAQKVILGAVESKVGGLAAATGTGTEKMATAWGNMKEAIGAKFLPVIDAVTAALTPLIQKITSSPTALTIFAAVLGGAVVGAFIAAAVAAWTFVAPLIALALPFILIAIGIALVIAAVVLLVKHWDKIKQKTAEVWDAIKAKLAAAWDAIKAKSAAVWAAILAWISAKWNAIKATVVSKGAAVLQWFRDLPGKIMGFLSKAGTWLLSVGEDIVNGLIRGIGNGFAWVKAKIQELGGNVLTWAKQILHIGSPSKLMADEVGRWIPAGIAMGIDANASSVHSSMASLTSDLGATARAGAGLSLSGVGASSSPANRPIVMPDGTLFGWIADIADGRTELHLNRQAIGMAVGS